MRNRIISGVATALIMLLAAIVLLSFGYDPPDPPIPEEGVEVNVGNSDMGLGESAESVSTAAATQAPASPNQLATQQAEPTPNLNASSNQGNTVKPTSMEQPKEEVKEPEINKNALFPGRRNQQSGTGSQGVSSGTGDQGKPNGTPNSNNYEGNGGGNGSFSLSGRSNITLPKPQYSSNEQGTVVIQIWVNREGKVIRAEYQPKGSNTSNGYLVGQARAAALKARFNADASAPDEQKGTITYIFKI